MTNPSIGWACRQQTSLQRALGIDGKSGLARMQQFVGNSGREILRRTMPADLPFHSLSEVTDMRLLEVNVGHVVFDGVPLPHHIGSQSTAQLHRFAASLDLALGCAVQTTLQAGQSYSTAEISFSIVRPVSYETGTLRAVGVLLDGNREFVRAEAYIEDEAGKRYAYATTTCVVFDMQKI